MLDWRETYKEKLIMAEDAAMFVKSGGLVVFTPGREALAVGLAIAARKEELKGVKVVVNAPGYDFGWYDAGWEDSFFIRMSTPTATCQQMIDEKRCDFDPSWLIPYPTESSASPRDADMVITEVSPPDEKGFCSFGASLWNKKTYIRDARLVIAEVNENLIRTCGENFVHVSELDYLVEHISLGGAPGQGSLAGRALKEPEPYLKDVAGYVSELIKDRDTLQIGVGRTTEPLIGLGMLDGKHDLGYHSEATPPGIITLVREGVINGKYKTLNPGKVVVTSIGGSTREEMEWVNMNPLFWLVDVDYLEDVRVIAAHDNMVSVNNILMIDLGGQITSETIGGKLLAGPGGQTAFVVGAQMSKGGRFIAVVPSTAQGGRASRIVPALPEGTVVTVARNLADIVVTEYGVARLKGKTLRERANELISVAHPDFRAELKKAAQKLFDS